MEIFAFQEAILSKSGPNKENTAQEIKSKLA